MRIEFVILGEPASKANSREIVARTTRDRESGELRTRPMSIKSDKARDYETAMLRQIPPKARQRLTGPVRVAIRIWYASERPDLDESVILDCLQDRYAFSPHGTGERRTLVHHGVYRNDRQVRQKVILHGIDRHNPRAHIIIEPLEAQQLEFALDETLDPFELIEA
ncbi:RusA family crossover junction endodeoxyribonuclease [Paraburkholderia adhaesiva]|uniref:RusA family crossover junction endodeoxyribonuclease n=1 Tax=Paraburkholderia adhaesiva TaxID=2883244 RepID=UPI001F45759B|nr:RusA family crossover junction endodeoxyribonuclease [Paraburkholderia adhaesiva]